MQVVNLKKKLILNFEFIQNNLEKNNVHAALEIMQIFTPFSNFCKIAII